MRTAGRMIMSAGCLFGLLVACVGGPGDGGTSSNRSGQNGTVEGASSGGPAVDEGSQRSKGESSAPNTKEIKATEFGRGCSTDGDCMAVFQGLVCTVCKCDTVAIAKTEQNKYEAERAKRSEGCSMIGAQCQPCAPVGVSCDQGTKQCKVNDPRADAG